MTAEPLRGADYFQVKPGEWALPDVAVLANGTQLGGARARLYWLLRWTAERGATHAIGRHTGPVGWVPSHICKEPWSGGGAGDRRLRDLRERGVRLESQVYVAPDGERTSTWLWRWAGDPPAGDAERAPTASRARGAAHRGRLVFRTQSGCPIERDGWVKWEVSPGSGHVLAPPSSLQAALITGHVTHDQAVAQYLDILRRRYSAGELDGVLSTRCAVLWVRPEVALDPLPTLRSVLVRCGAELNSDEK
ncbi:MAG TPA: hypothetical protein PK569_20005 [Thermoanaerobaculia bacterium]|nr:hypothetical protein [Thermoanaerobaculia bacterium]